MYNVTDLYNTTNYGDYISIINRESGYIFGIVLLFTVVLVVLIGVLTKEQNFGLACVVAGMVGVVVGIILFALEALSPEYIIIPLLLAAGGLIGSWIGRD